jgi:hypothetical protein
MKPSTRRWPAGGRDALPTPTRSRSYRCKPLKRFNGQTGVYSAEGEEIPAESEFIAFAGDTFHGWVRFDPDGGPTSSEMGPYFGDWKPPLRADLGIQTRLSGKRV